MRSLAHVPLSASLFRHSPLLLSSPLPAVRGLGSSKKHLSVTLERISSRTSAAEPSTPTLAAPSSSARLVSPRPATVGDECSAAAQATANDTFSANLATISTATAHHAAPATPNPSQLPHPPVVVLTPAECVQLWMTDCDALQGARVWPSACKRLGISVLVDCATSPPPCCLMHLLFFSNRSFVSRRVV